MTHYYFYFIVLFSIFLMACAKKDHDTHDHPKDFKAADYYKAHCSDCHSDSGMGKVLDGIPPVIYTDYTHSQMRKFIMLGASQDDKKFDSRVMPIFPKMPKKEARKITQHIDKLLKKKLKSK